MTSFRYGQDLSRYGDDASISIKRFFENVADSDWVYRQIRDRRRLPIRKMMVPADLLIATQETLSVAIVRNPPSLNYSLPEAVLLDGEYFVIEGHHRIAHRMLNGEVEIYVKVDEYLPQ